MDYQKIYNALVEKAKVRGLDKSKHEEYLEKHHIIPKCLGGDNSDDNFVLLTAREHVIAHHLLWKANPDNKSLMWAYSRTLHTKNGNLKNSRQVEFLKKEKAKAMSERFISEETKQKIRESLTGHKRSQESIEKGRQKVLGQKRSEETRKKLSEKRKEIINNGWTMPEEARKKIGDSARGRKVSVDHKEKISKSMKGRKLPDHVKQATSEYQKSLHPWQRARVVSNPERIKVWKRADILYKMWIKFNSPGCWSFSVMSDIDSTKYSTHHFETIVKLFKSGWIPTEDECWVEYKTGCEDNNG